MLKMIDEMVRKRVLYKGKFYKQVLIYESYKINIERKRGNNYETS